jgi:hypothetical protein
VAPDNQNLSRTNPTAGAAEMLNGIQALSPKNDAQRKLQAQALSMAFTIGNERWLMLEEQTNSISLPLLAMLVFWLVIVFAGFGLFSPTNTTIFIFYRHSVCSSFSFPALSLAGYHPVGAGRSCQLQNGI